MAAIPTILKGDDSGSIDITIASGRTYTGATLVVAYQGITRTFTNLVAGGTVSLVFTHDETSGMELKTAPVLMRLIGATGGEETVENADARIRVTDCLSEVNAGGSFAVAPRTGTVDPTKVPITEVGDVAARYTLADLQAKVNQIVRVLAQRSLLSVAVAILGASAVADVTVQSARLDSLYNDATVVTNVTGGGIEPNAVKSIVNSEVGGTNAVKEAVATVEANAASWTAKQDAISDFTTTNAVRDIVTSYEYVTKAVTNGLASEVWVGSQGYLTEHQSLAPATNYANAATLAATNALGVALRREIASQTPGNYAAVSNAAMNAVTKEVLRDAIWTNEVNQLWRDLELEVKTYAHDPVTDRYYKLYADSKDGRLSPAINTNGVEYADIADPYWRRYATNYLGDVTAFVVSVTNGQEFSITYSIPVGTGGGYIDWGDGNSEQLGVGSQLYSFHTYDKAGYYIVSSDWLSLIRVFTNDLSYVRNNNPIVNSVIRALSFSSRLTSVKRTFYCCNNLRGEAPPLDKPNLTNIDTVFGNSSIESIPVIANSPKYRDFAFVNCFHINRVDLPNDADVSMPTTVSSFNCHVQGASYAARKRFFTSWGGSNGWTGEYYTSSNAPVPSLVGERIYEPIGNVNSFEIKLAPNDYSNNVFTFEMRLKSFPNRNIRVDWGDGTLTTYPSNTFASAMTLVSHDYTKPTGNATNRYCVCIDSGASNFSIGTSVNNDSFSSRRKVNRILSYSDTVVGGLYCFYFLCRNAIGTIPPWGKSVEYAYYAYTNCDRLEGQIPEWTENIKTANACYYVDIPNSRVTGQIPRWEYKGNMDVKRIYINRTGLTIWNSATAEELMPSNYIHSFEAGAYPVSGATQLMPHFYQSWGGTIPDPE